MFQNFTKFYLWYLKYSLIDYLDANVNIFKYQLMGHGAYIPLLPSSDKMALHLQLMLRQEEPLTLIPVACMWQMSYCLGYNGIGSEPKIFCLVLLKTNSIF